MVAGLQVHADKLGLPFGPRSRTYNSRLAQELGLWAAEKGCGHSFHMAAFHAYFAKGKNLAEEAVLLELARTAGLSADEAQAVLATRSYRAHVDRDWQEAHRLQITAVPTFVLDNSRLVGAQSYATLARLMLQHGVQKKEDS
jgi:predicted DsbA family dithiol-disulfide isomerase